jgi:hypothetical protein
MCRIIEDMSIESLTLSALVQYPEVTDIEIIDFCERSPNIVSLSALCSIARLQYSTVQCRVFIEPTAQYAQLY